MLAVLDMLPPSKTDVSPLLLLPLPFSFIHAGGVQGLDQSWIFGLTASAAWT